MITFDSLTLKAFIEENKKFLTGARIQRIQQPTRRDFVLAIRGFDKDGKSVVKKLYININPQYHHVCFMSKDNESKRLIEIPQKPPMFCMLLRKYLENAKICKVNQPPYERILELYVETFNELAEKIFPSNVVDNGWLVINDSVISGFIVVAVLLIVACWRWTGVNILYFLAGLQSIDTELYEAASIDGANKWQQFLKISVPLLKPTTVYVLTISIYAGLAMFLESFMLWKGNNSPQNIGLTIVGYLYRQGIEKRAMGYACAVGLVLLIVVMIINMIQLIATGTFKKEER